MSITLPCLDGMLLAKARVMAKMVLACHIHDKVLTVGRVPKPDREDWLNKAMFRSKFDGFLESFVDHLPESFETLV